MKKKKDVESIVSYLDQDNTLVELLFDSKLQETSLAVSKNNKSEIVKEYVDTRGKTLVPYSPKNNLIKHEIVLFPSKPEEYNSKSKLLDEIRAFIHRYVDIDPILEKLAAHYVLLTWLYDAFKELPYLRKKGDFGTGKTRFLQTIGSLCYKPIFASGASTVSPIFYILDTFGGTLLIDEADFRFSDEKSDIVKILNNGNVKGFPILRSVINNSKEYSPRGFRVFGPKIVGSRREYQDKALESRFIEGDTNITRLRSDIPISLPDIFHEEALSIRNKLLLFRFQNLSKISISSQSLDSEVEPRLRQIYQPLFSIIDDQEFLSKLVTKAKTKTEEIQVERGTDIEIQILKIIKELIKEDAQLSIKEIALGVFLKHGDDHIRRITPKWIGSIIRNRLNLKTIKSNGIYWIPDTERKKIKKLYADYCIY